MRPFMLMVDSGSREEPPTRYFGSLDAALAAMDEYEERWKRHAWIVEGRGAIRTTHVQDGARTTTAPLRRR